MKKRLNNKGLTMVEILVASVLLVVVVVSLYSSIETYSNKEHIEYNKERIVKYKNLLTKEIQDDLIKKGLVDAKVSIVPLSVNGSAVTPETYTVNLHFRDDSTKILKVELVKAVDYHVTDEGINHNLDDSFVISYGNLDNMVQYPLPELGFGENLYKHKVQDLRIDDVNINTNNDILNIYIGFFHQDFGRKYNINIICPINYFG